MAPHIAFPAPVKTWVLGIAFSSITPHRHDTRSSPRDKGDHE